MFNFFVVVLILQTITKILLLEENENPFEIWKSQLDLKSWSTHKKLKPCYAWKIFPRWYNEKNMFQKENKNLIPEVRLSGLIVSTYSSSSFTICFKMYFLFLPLWISVMLRSKFWNNGHKANCLQACGFIKIRTTNKK